MNRIANLSHAVVVTAAGVALAVCAGGCMVGPDYKEPPAPVADSFRDPQSETVNRKQTDLTSWWTTFEDPILNELVRLVHEHNPTLQVAAVRVLESQARRGIAVGLLFPQAAGGLRSYTRNRVSVNQFNVGNINDRNFDNFELGAAAAWELDIWGRFRRGIEAADAEVLSAMATYDDALVSLTGQVASEYVSVRILQERLAVTEANVAVQKRGLQIAEDRFAGGTATELDRQQATTLLRDTEARIPDLEASIIQTQNRLCVLLGIPPKDLSAKLGDRKIPVTPATVAVGIPADLLRRRPDIRRAERDLAAQSARIGVAKTDFYPSFSLVGDIRLSSENFGNLFAEDSIQAFGGPTFRWAIFNYGRIENNVRVEDARFQALIGSYEDTVLRAQGEVENSIAGYVGAGRQINALADSVKAATRAVEVAEAQYRGGTADFTRVLNTQDALQVAQDRLVSARGAVALNLVSLYRAMGGGWELRSEKIPVDEKSRQQMRERTDWGKMLD